MSSRSEVISALETTLKGIKKSAGYNTDAGNNVSVWKLENWTRDNLPAIDIRDTGVLQKESPNGVWDFYLKVDIICLDTSYSGLLSLMDDVYKAVYTDITLSGKSLFIRQPDEDFIEAAEEDFVYFAAKISLKVAYRATIGTT